MRLLGTILILMLKAGNLQSAQEAAWGSGAPEQVKRAMRQVEREGMNTSDRMTGDKREDWVLSGKASHFFLVRSTLCNTAERRAWVLARD